MAYYQRDSERWRQTWYKKMSPINKIFLEFLYDNCESCGIWKIDVYSLDDYGLGEINIDTFLNEVNRDFDNITREEIPKERIVKRGNILWLTQLIAFRYGYQHTIELTNLSQQVLGILDKLNAFQLLNLALEKKYISLDLDNLKKIVNTIQKSKPNLYKTLLIVFGKGLETLPKPTNKNKNLNNKINYKEFIKLSNEEKKNLFNSKEKTEIQILELVHMSNHEIKKLLDQYGETKVKDMCENLDDYKASTGKKYKSDYRTVLKWEKKNQDNNGNIKIKGKSEIE